MDVSKLLQPLALAARYHDFPAAEVPHHQLPLHSPGVDAIAAEPLTGGKVRVALTTATLIPAADFRAAVAGAAGHAEAVRHKVKVAADKVRKAEPGRAVDCLDAALEGARKDLAALDAQEGEITEKWKAAVVADRRKDVQQLETELTAIRTKRGVVGNRAEILRTSLDEALARFAEAERSAALAEQTALAEAARAELDRVAAEIAAAVGERLPALAKALAAADALAGVRA